MKTRTRHGMSGTNFYKRWDNMIGRCYHKSSDSYRYYGGKGVEVCDRWRTFDNFMNDMLESFEDGLTLDRIDSSKNYSVSNCRWATPLEQVQNRGIMKSNKTGFIGVSKIKSNGKYRASIRIDGIAKNLGSFVYAHTAALVYDSAVIMNELVNKTTNYKLQGV